MPNSASGTRAAAAKPGHKRLRLIAQVLPLLALIGSAVTLWVPVLDSADNTLVVCDGHPVRYCSAHHVGSEHVRSADGLLGGQLFLRRES